MVVLAGQVPGKPLCGVKTTLSVNLRSGTASYRHASVEAQSVAAADGPMCANTRIPSVLVGASPVPMFGSCLFEKMLVLPRKKLLGFLVGAASWLLEVWNTHTASAMDLTAVSTTGAGGVVVDGPTSKTFWPGQCQGYTLSVPAAGLIRVSNVVIFSFPGTTGTEHTVTGTRLQVFPARCDWSDPYSETISFNTEVLQAWNRKEQRIRHRTNPRYALSYRVCATSPREAIQLHNLLYDWGTRIFGVPVWPELAHLTFGVMPGATSIPMESSNLPSFTGMLFSGQIPSPSRLFRS